MSILSTKGSIASLRKPTAKAFHECNAGQLSSSAAAGPAFIAGVH